MQKTLLTRIAHQIQTHLQTINRHIRAFNAGFQHLDHHPIQFESLENRQLLSAVSFNESLHGDLSANAANNPTLTLDLGQNTISGSVSHLNDAQDQFTINLLDGQSITSVTLQTTSSSSPFGIADIMITGNSLLEHAFATTGTQIITDTGFSISSPTLPIDGNWSDTITVMANFAFPNAQYELILTVEETPSQQPPLPNPNTPPIANNDAITIDNNTQTNINVLANDTDDDGDTLTPSLLSDPTHGTATLNPDGTINYTPNANFVGIDTFTYMIDDGNGGTDAALVEITVNQANRDPLATDDTFTVTAGNEALLNVLLNDSDPDADMLSVSIFFISNNASAVVTPEGDILYTANSNFAGTDTLIYALDDGNGGTTTGMVEITVNPAPEPPLSTNDQVTINEDDAPLTINVLLNDNNLDDPTVEILSDASANTNFTLNDDGTITFNTNGDFDSLSQDESTTREITYRVTNHDGLSDTATLTVNILGQNDAPILVNQPDDISIKQGDASSPIDLTEIFNDVDTNDTLRYLVSTEDPDLISTQIVNGRLTVTTSSTLTGTATLKVSAIDSNGATMTTTMKVTVQPQTQTLNDQLMSLKDSLKEMKKDGAISNRYFKNLSKTIDRAMKKFDRGNFFAGIRQLYVLKFKIHILDCRNKISHDDAKNLNSMANESIKTAFKQALENHKQRCWRRFR